MSNSYTGGDNLDVMLDAHNYNGYLKALVQRYSGDCSNALDFGAGIGTFTDALLLPADQIACVEPDAAGQVALKRKGYEVYDSLEGLAPASFDYVFSLNVLEHIEDDLAAARLLHRLIRPGGRLFVYVPAFNHIRTSMDDLVGHHRRYSRGTLIALLKDAGFQVESVGYTDFLGYFATIAFRLLDAFKREPDGKINRPMLIAYDRFVFPLSRLLSVLFRPVLGKNVYAVATKRPSL